jgi:hypothetical protein
MVTDIQFGDLNGDGKAEMVVVGDWMPVTVFQSIGKTLIDIKKRNNGMRRILTFVNCIKTSFE